MTEAEKKYIFDDVPQIHPESTPKNERELKVLCRYAEVWSTPQKRHKNLLFSYSKSGDYTKTTALFVRNADDIAEALLLKKTATIEEEHEFFNLDHSQYRFYSHNEIARLRYIFRQKWKHTNFDVEGTVIEEKIKDAWKAFAGFWKKMFRAEKIETYNTDFSINFENKFSHIGELTGNYYIDTYGYVWLQANLYYLRDPNATGWLRETAVDYQGKKDLAETWQEKQKIVLTLRSGKSLIPKPKKNNKKFITLSAMALFALKQ